MADKIQVGYLAQPPYYLNPFLLHFFKDLNIKLQVTSPIAPGDPIFFRWTSWPLLVKPLDLGTITFSLHLVDSLGNIDPQAVLYTDDLSAQDSQTVVRGPFDSGPLEAESIPDELAKRIYLEGLHTLCLVIKGTGTSGPFQSNNATFKVALPMIDDSWWMWTVPTSRTVKWKQDKYTVSGALTNKSSQSVAFSVTLLENNVSDTIGLDKVDPNQGEAALSTDAPNAPLGPGGNIAVTFPVDLSKSWQWFIFGIFTSSGPTVQRYSYRVRLDLMDPFTNSYPPFFTTQNITVTVEVSNTKFSAQQTAFGLMVAAATEAVMAAAVAIIYGFGEIAAAVLIGIASALVTAALISGAIASDPPIPDRRYRVLYQAEPVRFPESKEMAPVIKFYEAVADVIAHVEALGQTDSRIAGAMAARSSKATTAQQKHFNSLRRRLSALQRKVRETMPAALTFASENPRRPSLPKADEAIRMLAHDPAFRAQLHQKWMDVGGRASGFETLEGILAAPEFSMALENPERIVAAIGSAAQQLAQQAASLSPEGTKAKRAAK